MVGVEENYMQSQSVLLFFRDKKEQILKVFLTCTFNPGLLSFHLPSYGSESRKRRAKAVSG